MRTAQKIIGWYFFIGAIALYLFYLSIQTPEHLLLFLVPNTIATFVFLLYLVVSYYYLKDPMGEVSETAFIIMLFIQSLGIQLFGFGFNNVYFPELSIKINLQELTDVNFHFTYFKLQMLNGYFRDNSNNSISINLLLVGLLFFISYCTKKLKRTEDHKYCS